MPERIVLQQRSAVFHDLQVMNYSRALELQEETVRSKSGDPEKPDHLFFVEHPGVFTLGKRGGSENLVVSRSFLAAEKIDIVQTNRGGNITYHGPGQAVLYPVVDLEKNRIGVKDFVYGLEEIMKQTALDFGVSADRDARNHGLWVKDAKIGSVGIAVKKGITYHGLAMNVSMDLTPFSWINPCGMAGISMTSLKQESALPSPDLSMPRIKASFLNHFSTIFNFTITAKNETE